ncbi:MAG: efflux RND transporter periplasmic adaptor subunit, partial [Bacteroidota bacterium]|nr:efflux RND transporter periplasmic adaptor subunit [Bacteroidota bacterium]
RNSPVIVQDVVTYGAVITVDNHDLALKPGMTATARIVTRSASNVTRIASSSLRFNPPGAKASSQPSVWILESDSLRRVEVQTGISDGEFTEIRSGKITSADRLLEELTPEGKKAYGITK